MEKINIAEILKDCSKGMELDCMMYENVFFDCVTDNPIYPIRLYVQSEKDSITLTSFGCTTPSPYAKCVIFPKGKTTWEGFQRPFKDGDILAYTSSHTTVFIYRNKENEPNYSTSFYVGCSDAPIHNFLIYNKYTLIALNGNCDVHLATKEEKQKLFQAIKANGYKWNEETKTLEKLVEPKFKVGDKIKDKNNKIWFVVQVSDKHFSISLIPNAEGYFVPIEDQDEYELVPNKFDINTLKPFDKVLVRNKSNEVWTANFYSHYDATSDKPFICVGWSEMNEYRYCIPYEVNNELLGTTNNTEEYGSR